MSACIGGIMFKSHPLGPTRTRYGEHHRLANSVWFHVANHLRASDDFKTPSPKRRVSVESVGFRSSSSSLVRTPVQRIGQLAAMRSRFGWLPGRRLVIRIANWTGSPLLGTDRQQRVDLSALGRTTAGRPDSCSLRPDRASEHFPAARVAWKRIRRCKPAWFSCRPTGRWLPICWPPEAA